MTTTPISIDYQGIKMESNDDDISVVITMDGANKGLRLDFDMLTIPKYFQLTPSGAQWSNGTNTYNSSLEDIALITTALGAIEIPPNSTTLKINEAILLDDNAGNNATLTMDTSGNLVIDPSQNVVVRSRVNQILNSDASWNAVNGYYSLAKDAYPALNPNSDGVKAVSSWTLRPLSAVENWVGITWSPQRALFVAVNSGASGSGVATSPDGVTWTLRSTPALNGWNDVCWSPELSLFVAVGSSGTGQRVMTSPDGITWTLRTSAADNNWRSVCWSPELSLFVAVSSTAVAGNQRIMTSPNGTTWTIRTAPNSNQWRRVIWVAELGLFVACSLTGTTDRIITSVDGINWFARLTPNANFGALTWSSELGLIVGLAFGTNTTMRSIDGINWVAGTSADGQDWEDVAWSPELGYFVACCSTSSNRIMVSSNAINWSVIGSTNIGNARAIYWSPEQGVFVGVNNSTTFNRAFTSSLIARPTTSYNVFDSNFNRIDNEGNWTFGKRVNQLINSGSTWSAVNGYYSLAKDAYPALNPNSNGVKAVTTWNIRTPTAEDWRSICWSPELRLFVAVGQTFPGGVSYSSDGITWTAASASAGNLWNSVCWAPELGLFVAVGSSNTTNNVMTSTNGTSWTTRTTPGGSNVVWRSICWSPELRLFVAVASTNVAGNLRVMTSSNGTSWTMRSAPVNIEWFSVCWSAEVGLFVAVAATGSNNGVMTSSDGITWNSRNPAFNNVEYRSVCWSPELGLFVAVASSGTIRVITSPDGINWTTRSGTYAEEWRSVCWSAELGTFVAVASTGTTQRVMSSPDGINWTLRTSQTNDWTSVCWSPELGIFAAVSNSGINRVQTSMLQARPTTSYNVFDNSFNNIDSSGNWTFKSKSIFSDGNITIDPSDNLIVLGDIDMSGNDIINTASISNTGNITIDPSNNLIVLGDIDMSGNDIINTASISNTGGTIEINGTQINLDATTIDFQNTSTTTSTANHNANIKATSSGLETTKFLKVKLNGADIWIPYFETDPSL